MCTHYGGCTYIFAKNTPLKHYFSKKTVAKRHILDIILYFRKILYNTSINKSLNELI